MKSPFEQLLEELPEEAPRAAVVRILADAAPDQASAAIAATGARVDSAGPGAITVTATGPQLDAIEALDCVVDVARPRALQKASILPGKR